jgi:hypothetical protein
LLLLAISKKKTRDHNDNNFTNLCVLSGKNEKINKSIIKILFMSFIFCNFVRRNLVAENVDITGENREVVESIV